MLTQSMYETMLENDEMWFLASTGAAVLINDAALLDV